MAMEQQLIEQAPDDAVGYRLVLPMRPNEDVPRMSPPMEISGRVPSWGLRPFQAPDDIRLVDSQVYRVLWTGTSGEIIPPKQNGNLPGLLFHLSVPALETETVEVDIEAGTPAPPELLSVQSTLPNPPIPLDDMDAEVQSMTEQLARVISEIDGMDTPSGDEEESATPDWVPPKEWLADFKTKTIRDALLSIEGVWKLSPDLHEEPHPVLVNEPDSYQRFRTQLHAEVAVLVREAESKLGDGTAASLLAERTELFIKDHVLKALDRWDLILGRTDPESASKESIGGLAKQALGRVHCALLLWLEGIGITAFQPRHQQFNAMLHHRHGQVHLNTIPPGYIVRVLRSGYLRDEKLLRRAHVIVAR
jgi:molecular chaperone GrpE (heat shock protein)